MQVFKGSAMAFVAATLLAANSSGQQADGQLEMLPLDCVQVHEQLRFSEATEPPMLLDLYVPEKTASSPPLLLCLHGSRQNHSKSRLDSIILELTDKGYAVASLGSRSKVLSANPDRLQVCKGATRWLRAHAEQFGYDASRIGVVGGSGGAPLALGLAVTANVAQLEGTVAGHLDQSSRVHAVVNFCEASDVSESLKDDQRPRSHNRMPGELNSLEFLTPDDAPLLLIQGTPDESVQVGQGQVLFRHYQKAGLEATLCTLQVVGHGGTRFSDDARHAMVAAFFDKHIKQIQRDVFAEQPAAKARGEVTGNQPPRPDRDRRRLEFGKRFAARGAQVGEAAPDATVYTLAGEPLKLSSLWQHKPAVLVTGSITCPIAYRNCPSLRPLQDDYADAVNVVILYQREAHPKQDDPATDGRPSRFRGSTFGKYPQPKTQDERLTLAKVFDEHMGSTVQIVVAGISDDLNQALGTGPNMGLLIDREGKIVAKQGWYDGEVMQKAIVDLLLTGRK